MDELRCIDFGQVHHSPHTGPTARAWHCNSQQAVPDQQRGERISIAPSREMRGTLLTQGAWRGLSTGGKVVRGTLVTLLGDSADATRGYPGDSADEANSSDK